MWLLISGSGNQGEPGGQIEGCVWWLVVVPAGVRDDIQVMLVVSVVSDHRDINLPGQTGPSGGRTVVSSDHQVTLNGLG